MAFFSCKIGKAVKNSATGAGKGANKAGPQVLMRAQIGRASQISCSSQEKQNTFSDKEEIFVASRCVVKEIIPTGNLPFRKSERSGKCFGNIFKNYFPLKHF